MFRRAFWFSTGAAAGVWATTKVNRKLRSLTPDSLAGRAADRALETGQRLRGFALDVRSGMAQRESELHDVLGLDAPVGADRPGLPAQPARPLPATVRVLPALPGRKAERYEDGQPPKHAHTTEHSHDRTRDREYDRNEDH